MDNIIIIGAGRHGAELYTYLKGKEDLNFVGFIDELKKRGRYEGSKIIGNFNDLEKHLAKHRDIIFKYITATGDNGLRQRIVGKIEGIEEKNIIPYTLIYKNVVMGKDVEIGEGTCLAPGVILTTNINVGKHCIINVKTSISHDCVVGDFTSINPGVTICGNVKIGKECFIGAGATIINKIVIGKNVVVGAGASVIRDVPDDITVVGVPAKIVKQR